MLDSDCDKSMYSSIRMSQRDSLMVDTKGDTEDRDPRESGEF